MRGESYHRKNSTTIDPNNIIMKSTLVALVLATAALTLASCASKKQAPAPAPVDTGVHSGK